ncbi:MAG: non-heme iron oxygenase ferredoxin subunit [Steroidobacteraceae bacterium]|nr:non-heme iron oxygenase ferredoxin subunit [Steroidobacteraceae bacterium]
MSAWVDVGPAAALAAGARLLAEVDGYYLQVVRVADELYAFEDRCTHDDAPLDDAEIEELEIICPRHGARFCLRTGAALTPPAYEPLKTFAVRQQGERIEVQAP